MRRFQVLFLMVLSTFGLKGLTQSFYEKSFSNRDNEAIVKVNFSEENAQKTLASGNWAGGGTRTN